MKNITLALSIICYLGGMAVSLYDKQNINFQMFLYASAIFNYCTHLRIKIEEKK